MTEFKFNTREEYFACRDEWKAEYKQLTADIREAKSQRKQYTWEYRPEGNDSAKRRTKVGNNPKYDSYAGCRAAYLRVRARDMMAMLDAAKVTAREQRDARLKEEALKVA